MEKEKLGIFLAQLRKDRNLTQRELADRLYVSVSTISKWEKGVSTPNIYFLEKIAEALDVPAVELIECQIDIGMEKAPEVETKAVGMPDADPAALAAELPEVGQIHESETVVSPGKIRRIICAVLAAAAIMGVLLSAGYAYYCSLPVEMEIIDSYYIANSDFYNDDIYFVIVEYDGRLTDDIAIDYAMKHQENYKQWFDMADGIIFAFFHHYKGREHVMDADNKVVFVPYKGP